MSSQQQPQDLSVDKVCAQGLSVIRQLRQQTHKTIDFLREGVQAQNDEVLGMSDELIFVKDVKQRLSGIMETFEQLEKLTSALPKQPPNFAGNLNYLMQNAISEHANTSTDPSSYEKILKTYNWNQRSQEYGQLSTMFISQYMRRNQSKLFPKPPPVSGFTMQQLCQAVLPQFLRMVPGLQWNTVPRGRNTILIFITVCAVNQPTVAGAQATVGAAVVKFAILARANPFYLEWTNVKGADEDFYDDSGKAWLGSHRNLFNEPCGNCKRILRDYLPPYCRDYRKINATFHESCK